MNLDPQTPVGDIVAARLGRSRILAGFGIDFCCGGHRTLNEAARLAGHEAAAVIAALAAADAEAAAAGEDDATDWRSAPLADLTDHLERTHHDYMKRALPWLGQLMDKVVAAHGINHPELAETAAVFGALRAELEDHLQKEERILFPMIRGMEASRSAGGLHCGSINAPIGVMEREHDDAGEALRRLRVLTADYTAPEDACTTYRALLDGLAEMEGDLHLHIHKENNILHPRASRLEAALAASTTTAGKGKA